MNWLDILLIILLLVVVILGFVWLAFAISEDEACTGVFGLLIALGIAAFLGVMFWLKTDTKSGQTVGEITSVDKNFFGTTAVYIKTNATSEERYCVENSDIVDQAKDLVGKKVKITYGKRVGFYSVGRCDDAPIDSIEVME